MIGIETKTLPATNTKPRRILAFTCTGHRKIVRFPDCEDVRAHFIAARALIAEQFTDPLPHDTMAYGGTKLGYFFCWPQSTIEAKE